MPPVVRIILTRESEVLPRPRANASAGDWTQWSQKLAKATVWQTSVDPEYYKKIVEKCSGRDDPWWTGVPMSSTQCISLIKMVQSWSPQGPAKTDLELANLFNTDERFLLVADDI
jgi:hypothetical protein